MTALTKETFQPNPFFVITGRQQAWLSSQNKVLPVSCTMIQVEDSYHDINHDQYGRPLFDKLETIAGSWDYVSHAIKTSCGVAIDLSKIRAKGTIGSGGMVAQGVTNWMHYYSDINEDTIRGSVFKNGAVVMFLDYDHPDILDFLNYPVARTAWAKRAVYIDADLFTNKNSAILDKLIKELEIGNIFVCKKSYDENGERVFSQVCVEILVKSRQTCSLGHVNLGMISDENQLPMAIKNSMEDLVNLWKLAKKEIENSNYYKDPEDDPQVGLGLIGLANLLCNMGVTYLDFVLAMERLVYGLDFDEDINPQAYAIAFNLVEGYGLAMEVARKEGLVRAFTIAPTATCAFRYKDINGFTCSPEISPPVADPVTKMVERVSERNGKKESDVYQYPQNIEICGIDVDWQLYDRLVQVFQELMNDTGLAHTISYNWWLSKPVNYDTFFNWFNSNLQTIYYRWEESSSNTSKVEIQIESTIEDEDFWSGEPDIMEDDFNFSIPQYDLDSIKTELEQSISAVAEEQWFWGDEDTLELEDLSSTPQPICEVKTQKNDKNACQTCS
jgi:Ribonucleotide reductase, barrel domain